METNNDFVCIRKERYADLIRAETQVKILFNAYQQMTPFAMEPVMDAIFNPKFKHKGSGGNAE